MSPRRFDRIELLETLERRLGYRFVDKTLLELALTHRSHASENNERLEFLGDAALGFIIADWLYRIFPDAQEHDLTVMRASLVKRPSLARVAREIELGQYLQLGAGELKSGGHQRESILADTLEAIFGAVLRDGGVAAITAVIDTLFAHHVSGVDASLARDSKTKLQELLQSRHLRLPEYVIIAQSGDAHAPEFTVACRVDDLGIVTEGRANSRREAEQLAAAAALVAVETADGS
jgi:ribonuclease III